jgi:adenosylhomocysteinase
MKLFSFQALCTEYLITHLGDLAPVVLDVPADIDRQVAELKVAALGIELDQLSPEQSAYLRSCEAGT